MQTSRLRQILIAVKKQRYLSVQVTKNHDFSGDMVHQITELTKLDLPQSEVYNLRYKIMKSTGSAGFDRF
jgi:hypothetical protein